MSVINILLCDFLATRIPYLIIFTSMADVSEIGRLTTVADAQLGKVRHTVRRACSILTPRQNTYQVILTWYKLRQLAVSSTG